MANVTRQGQDKTKNVKAGAASSNSVPQLRAQVVTLAEAVERLEKIILKLRRGAR